MSGDASVRSSELAMSKDSAQFSNMPSNANTDDALERYDALVGGIEQE